MNMQPIFIELPSAPMQEIYHKIQQVGESELSFFIVGETGVGKEGVAQYIHKNGPRRGKPFIAINCGRFTPEFLQSELFGHEAGAFTGANHQRQGAFETANGGVLFLDEITEMPLEGQKMLLRVLDTKTFTRLGGNESLTTDTQIVAATNRDIGKSILETEFRPDLFYRLMDIMLDIPPLRDRPEDIVSLVTAFIHEFKPKRGKGVTGITPAALTRLERAAWPGNIRQLRSTIRTAIALATTDKLTVKDFPYNFFIIGDSERTDAQSDPKKDLPDTQDSIPRIISQLRALPTETQNIVIQAISEHLPSHSEKEIRWMENMNLREILHQLAEARIAKYATLSEAAASLGVDIRTLQKYAQYAE